MLERLFYRYDIIRNYISGKMLYYNLFLLKSLQNYYHMIYVIVQIGIYRDLAGQNRNSYLSSNSFLTTDQQSSYWTGHSLPIIELLCHGSMAGL